MRVCQGESGSESESESESESAVREKLREKEREKLREKERYRERGSPFYIYKLPIDRPRGCYVNNYNKYN